VNADEAKRLRSSAAWKRARRVVLAEEDYCGICGKEVDKSLPRGLPGSPEVDHIIPLEKGGAGLDRKNHMLTHKLCNQKKGHRIYTAADKRHAELEAASDRYVGPEEDWSSILGG
jgi:5-methylcytosine-specific restriction endonuclease McrA